MSPQLVQNFWVSKAQDGALTVKQDMRVQFSRELKTLPLNKETGQRMSRKEKVGRAQDLAQEWMT